MALVLNVEPQCEAKEIKIFQKEKKKFELK